MSPTLTILLLIIGWLTVAGAMLWGVMRVSRRHHLQAQPTPQAPPAEPIDGRLHI